MAAFAGSIENSTRNHEMYQSTFIEINAKEILVEV